MNYLRCTVIILFVNLSFSAYAQGIKADWLIGNWDLTVYELKGKDQKMTLLFDNSNVDSSFQVLVDKMANDVNQPEANIPADSLALLKKEYIQQVKYLSKSYFKFLQGGKCKHNLINDKQKFRTVDDTYGIMDQSIVLGDGSRYKIISLLPSKLIIQSNNGKIQLTYTKE
ncbi:MAG TPA: hypothetical protein VK750_05590 [Cytophagaceae bacterium]|jgi:hypothetical protein|nr:hypothetical protein [Cytophagaceae bacterium]